LIFQSINLWIINTIDFFQVFNIINDFFDKNPLAIVLFKGSDERRQRLYRIVISQEFPKLSQQFRIFGSIGEIIEPFEANRSYDFFLVTKLSD
jgi:hypothetical protein